MNIFIRSWRSVLRKPTKSLVLAGIIWGISVFLMIAIAIYNHQNSLQNEIRNQVGASFRLEIDNEDLTRRMIETGDTYVIEFELNGHPQVTDRFPNSYSTIIREDIEKISQVKGITEMNIHGFGMSAIPVDFEQITTGGQQIEWDMVNISPVLNGHLVDEAVHEFITVKEGRWIESEDRGQQENALVISEELARLNNLRLGDELTFKILDTELKEILEAIPRGRRDPIYFSGEIAGIFSIERPIFSHFEWAAIENTLFANLDIVENVMGEVVEGYHYTLAVFHVDDVDDYEEIREQILNLDIDWTRYNFVDASGMLERLSSDFNGLERISALLFSIALGAGFIMLVLIFTFWVRNRTHEIAIFLSLGIEKIKIILQLLMEALMISLISFLLALASVPIIPHVINPDLLSYALQDSSVDGSGIVSIGGEGVREATMEHFADQAVSHIQVTPLVFGLVIISTILLIALSIFTATLPIIRMKPRDIFSKTS